MLASDDHLVALVAATQDRAAFGELVRRHQGVVRGMLARLTRERALAEDLAQDAFIRAFQRIGSFRGEGSFKSWLCRIAYVEFLMHRRKGRAADRVLERYKSAGEVEPAPAFDRGEAVDLDRALAELSGDERACIILCYACGMSHSEAAAATGLPLGTVKSHVSRGREKMKAQMTSTVVTP